MRLFAYITVFGCIAVYSGCVHAKPLPEGWSGNLQLGGVQTTGNAQSSTVDGKFRLNYVHHKFQNTLHLGGLYASTNGSTSAQSWMGGNQARYSFTKHDYLFGLLNAQVVRFSGYDYQVSEVIGLGRRLYDSQRQTLDIEAGVGARQSRVTGERETDVGVSRLGADYELDITQHSSFHQHFSAEMGVNNTYVQSVSALKMAIYGALSANLSYTIAHNSHVPSGTHKTDTITSVALQYGF